MNRSYGARSAVSQRQGDVANSQLGGNLARASGEVQVGALTRLSPDFEFFPGNAVLNAGAEGLGSRFLGREPRCKALCAVLLALAVSDLLGRKDTGQEAGSIAGNGPRDTFDFNDVDAGSDEHEGNLNHFDGKRKRKAAAAHSERFLTPQKSHRRTVNGSTAQSDQTNVRNGYESDVSDGPGGSGTSDGWMLRLTARSPEEPEKTVRVLTGALLACGGWVLTRTQEKGIAALDFEFARAACVEIYAVLIGCGLELSRDSHLRMAELCHCTKNLIESKAFDIARVDLIVYRNGAKRSQGESETLLPG